MVRRINNIPLIIAKIAVRKYWVQRYKNIFRLLRKFWIVAWGRGRVSLWKLMILLLVRFLHIPLFFVPNLYPSAVLCFPFYYMIPFYWFPPDHMNPRLYFPFYYMIPFNYFPPYHVHPRIFSPWHHVIPKQSVPVYHLVPKCHKK